MEYKVASFLQTRHSPLNVRIRLCILYMSWTDTRRTNLVPVVLYNLILDSQYCLFSAPQNITFMYCVGGYEMLQPILAALK